MAWTPKATGSGIATFLNFLGLGAGDQATALVPATVCFPSPDQDPIFDHAAGTKTAVTASAVVLVPPAGCKFARVTTDVDIVVNTAGAAAVDDGKSVHVIANVPEIIPVTAAVEVRVLSLGAAAVVRVTPLKIRP